MHAAKNVPSLAERRWSSSHASTRAVGISPAWATSGPIVSARFRKKLLGIPERDALAATPLNIHVLMTSRSKIACFKEIRVGPELFLDAKCLREISGSPKRTKEAEGVTGGEVTEKVEAEVKDESGEVVVGASEKFWKREDQGLDEIRRLAKTE